jgi:hypothetical protein
MVELAERGVVVAPVTLERDDDVLARMRVMDRQRPRIAIGNSVLQALGAQHQQSRGK